MPWKIEPVNKKSIVDIEYYEKTLKNGKTFTIQKEQGYRWGYIIVWDDPREEIAEAMLKGEPLNTGMFGELTHDYNDGCWSDYRDVDALPKREQTLLSKSYWPDDAGWECVESETFFHGDLIVTQVSSEYPYDEIFEGHEEYEKDEV